MTPELSRPFAIDRIGDGTRFTVEASLPECEALARRMGLPAILSLICRFDLHPADQGAVLSAGHISARIVQTCVVSLEPFDTDVDETFLVRFVPRTMIADDLDLEREDEIPFEGTHIDLGEAASEQLALALDPFPRKPGAELPDSGADLDLGAFAALGKLRRPG